MRLIDADELLNKTAELEAVALEQVAKYEPSENPREWHRWSGILQERTAFKYDLIDAPTVDAEPIRHGHWIDDCRCSECGAEAITEWNETGGAWVMTPFCPFCGAEMEMEENT